MINLYLETPKTPFQNYVDMINGADGIIDELNDIIEQAANDDGLTNDEYCELYDMAIKSVRN